MAAAVTWLLAVGFVPEWIGWLDWHGCADKGDEVCDAVLLLLPLSSLAHAVLFDGAVEAAAALLWVLRPLSCVPLLPPLLPLL